MAKYNLTVINNSQFLGSACVYQEAPDLAKQGFMKLAWFAKTMNPATQVLFDWNIDYDFVWSEVGALTPGVRFLASQTLKADLTNNNFTTLEYNGGYVFSPTAPGPQTGSLYINHSAQIPSVNKASVGVGMSGNGTFASPAGPNLQSIYSPKPTYYITFGNYNQGQVMDSTITTPFNEIQFPTGVYDMTAILNDNNTWSVGPTGQLNAMYTKVYKSNPEMSYIEAVTKYLK